jgi:hypothetical protein
MDDEVIIGAISIDNSVFKNEGYKFKGPLLSQLEQFKSSQIHMVQTDIVHNEAIKYIVKELDDANALIDKALRSARIHLGVCEEKLSSAKSSLRTDKKNVDIANDRIREYYEKIGADLIDAHDYLDIRALMERFFCVSPPFENKKDKKNEFPDAVALLTLEAWAKDNNVNLLVVSSDKGWSDYCSLSEYLFYSASLSDSLERFQPQSVVDSVVAYIQRHTKQIDEGYFLEGIENAIVNSIDGYDIHPIADSYLEVECETTFAEYMSHELDSDDHGLVSIKVIHVDGDQVTIKLGAMVEVEVEGEFNFSVWDSIDKDYVYLGGTVCRTKEAYHTDIIICFTGGYYRNFSDFEVISIDVLDELSEADFGDIVPDYEGDNEH